MRAGRAGFRRTRPAKREDETMIAPANNDLTAGKLGHGPLVNAAKRLVFAAALALGPGGHAFDGGIVAGNNSGRTRR